MNIDLDFDLIHKLRQEKKTWNEIIEIVPNASLNTRKYYSTWLSTTNTQKLWLLPENKKPKERIVGVVGDYFVIDNTLYIHGIGSDGKDGVLNTALKQRMSVVQGHTHSYLGCKYMANARDIIFGLNVGCGVDLKAYAMEYGKYFVNKPTLGCGVVYDT